MNTIFNLWPAGKMPGVATDQPEGIEPSENNVQLLIHVSTPMLEIFPAPRGAEPAPAIVVCPGGGYRVLAYDLEGTEIATWLNSLGMTAVVLKYRVPDNRDGALQDSQRALRLARFHATGWNIDPARLGIMGFSAGGHLSARTSTNYERPAYADIDEADKLSCRPDFVILGYPAYLNAGKQVAPELPLNAQVPPTLIVHNEDDVNYVPGSKIYHPALTAAGVATDFLYYRDGGHGYGLRSDKSVEAWPRQTADWLRQRRILRAS